MNKDTIERMTDDGSGTRIVHMPQCVGCVHNQGILKCDALTTKPEKYMMNEETCPMYEKES